MSNKKFNGTREELYCLYWIEKLQTKDIAKKFNVSQGAIYRWLRKFNIPIRGKPHSEEHKRKIAQSSLKFKATKEELYELYIVQKLPVEEIANKYDVAKNTVWRWLKIYHIPLRGKIVYNKTKEKMSKAKIKFNISKEELFRLYVIERKSSYKIAEIFGVTGQTVLNWLKKYNISRRNHSENTLYLFKNQEFKEKFKNRMKEIKRKLWQNLNKKRRKSRVISEYRLWVEAVFKRDNYTCQKCGKKGGKLEAHHIFNWADYPELRYAIDNGITLCQKCHEEFHKQFGKRKNTRAQLEAFLRGWKILDGGKLNEASSA
jgi:transposase